MSKPAKRTYAQGRADALVRRLREQAVPHGALNGLRLAAADAIAALIAERDALRERVKAMEEQLEHLVD
ncbi:MAG: hypothetical protein FJ271_22880 [Planctomycetes bacterium]|nr:hypothetical protein [Planctomycetota bacterium]